MFLLDWLMLKKKYFLMHDLTASYAKVCVIVGLFGYEL